MWRVYCVFDCRRITGEYTASRGYVLRSEATQASRNKRRKHDPVLSWATVWTHNAPNKEKYTGIKIATHAKLFAMQSRLLAIITFCSSSSTTRITIFGSYLAMFILFNRISCTRVYQNLCLFRCIFNHNFLLNRNNPSTRCYIWGRYSNIESLSCNPLWTETKQGIKCKLVSVDRPFGHVQFSGRWSS